ncbi:MAG: ABC transporter ATP-binding protein [Planctomycetota bacterium]|jgi:ABC-2 type transport system ATP-binding protein|nr:ABC transporter ATP-binding protein [Planctomycetota bacterium]
MTALLQVDGLTYHYGTRVAVDGVSFEVQSGEILALLGPNGAGKTTAISCLCGLLAPRDGVMTFEGERFTPLETPSQRGRLGVVPQELALYEALTAAENLLFFAQLHGVSDPESAVARGLKLAALEGRAGDRVKTFSGGMKRRLNLAVGTLTEPSLTLLDEPMVGVDPQSRNHIFDSIENLRDQGRGILYTSHSMDDVERLCDRVAIMDHGKLMAIGTPAQLATEAGIPEADLERTFLELTGRSLRDESS